MGNIHDLIKSGPKLAACSICDKPMWGVWADDAPPGLAHTSCRYPISQEDWELYILSAAEWIQKRDADKQEGV